MRTSRSTQRAGVQLLMASAALLLGACGTTVSQSARATGGGSGGRVSATDGQQGLGPSPATGAGTGNTVGTDRGASGAATVGSTGQNGTAAAPTVGGSVRSTAPVDTSPLTIGITYADNSGVTSSFGFGTSSSVTPKSVAQALVRAINATGGLSGRKLKTVEYSFNESDTNFSTDAEAACAKFTQDNHVAVVLDTAFGTDAGFRDCLQKAGVLDITAGDEGDQASSRRSRLHANTAQLTHDRAYGAILVQLAASGYLTKANQIGVIVENCPEDTGPYTNTLLPLISRLGLKPPKESQIDCTTGYASAGAAAQSINSAVLAFHAAGVDRVMFVSGYESVLVLLFATNAESQHYSPGYMLSSNAQAQSQEANVPAGQRPQLHGVGNFPVLDVDGASRPTAVEARCVGLVQSGGVDPASYQDRVFVYSECGPFLLLEAALRQARGSSRPSELMTVINSLRASFLAPGLVIGKTNYTTTRHDGPEMVQEFGYVTSCSCLRYLHPPQRAPD
jgi:hypothetical protein